MNPQSMTWAHANATAEETRRTIARARRAATAAPIASRRIFPERTTHSLREARLAFLAMVKTLLVLIALAVAVAVVDRSQAATMPLDRTVATASEARSFR
jgi:hypothetical protein